MIVSEHPVLLFDIGNTYLKWGVSQEDRFVRTGKISHEQLKESGFGAVTNRLPRNVSRVLVSNVAGAAFATRLASVIGIHCNADLHYARSEKSAFGVTNSYSQPRRLGVDRWVAMIGARAEFRSALCVVDAGTALTIDAVDRNGAHLGGQIIPGMQLMRESLDSSTSDIGPVARKMKVPGSGLEMFASSTQAAVGNGALSAACGAIERAVRCLRSEGLRPKIVLTGGDASRILKQLEGNVIHRPNLVLQGLAFMVRSTS
jgi:type III pantothenate kinase